MPAVQTHPCASCFHGQLVIRNSLFFQQVKDIYNRILIVEDERAVARGMEYGLRSEGFEVDWAASAAQAFDLFRRQSPDLLILDIRLPDQSGLDICRQLRRDGHLQPILMLTARDEETDKVLGLELGADDYMVKPYGLRELVSRVRALLRRSYGEFAQGNSLRPIRFGTIELDSERLTVTKAGMLLELTPIEFRLLRYLVANPHQPFSRNQLIEQIWGYNSEIGDDRTVDVHMRHLRQKLEDDPANPRWLVTVRGMGYKFEG